MRENYNSCFFCIKKIHFYTSELQSQLLATKHQSPPVREFIHEKFESHEELEALRFKRIDELLSQYGKESESNEQTVKRVHLRVDRLETQIKTVKSFGTGIATLLGGLGAWMGLNNK